MWAGAGATERGVENGLREAGFGPSTDVAGATRGREPARTHTQKPSPEHPLHRPSSTPNSPSHKANRRAGARTFRLGVREQGRGVRERRLHGAAGADGARGGGDVAPDGDVAAHRERAHGLLRVEHDDEVGDVRADLQAPADAARRDARRRGPRAVRQPRDDEPRARLAGEDEAGLEDGEDREALGYGCGWVRRGERRGGKAKVWVDQDRIGGNEG